MQAQIKLQRRPLTVPVQPPPSLPLPRLPVDAVFATAVLAPTRIIAIFYWTRSRFHGKPLVLCDYRVGPLTASTWDDAERILQELIVERRSRYQMPMGLFLETEMLAMQASDRCPSARVIPGWLTRADSWHVMCQSAAGWLTRGDMGITTTAQERMRERPFLNEAGIYAGARPEDPTVPAFLYGVVLGLDEAAARDPNPKMPVRAARS